jgi:Tol biopolymer transport system component
LTPASSLVFLDPGLSDYQSLVTGVTAGTEIHLLNSSQDAVTQITQTLLGRDGITSLHIVSHGSVGGLDFGSSRLHLSDLPAYAAQLQSWSQALTADADLLLYGCNVAQGELGQAFTSILSQWTGADVAASDDLTGSSAQGGNWTLEVQTGQIAASLVFQASAITSYQSVLAVDLISQADPTMPNDSAGGSINRGSISSDGRYIAFTSGRDNLATNDTNNTQDVFLLDRQTGTTTLVSTTGTASGNNRSFNPVVSADGRYVAFTSNASNLVANDSNGTLQDVFVRDLVTGTTTLVSTTGTASGNSSSFNPVVSADGRYVAFDSNASNLVANDSNGSRDVFVRDLVTSTTTLVSTTGTTSGNNQSFNPVVSADGRYVAFSSNASNLVANDSNGTIPDVFVHDLVTGTTTLVSTTGNSSGNSGSFNPVVSADGRYVAFSSNASNLVANDSNTTEDVFVRDLVTGTTTLVSTTGTASGNRSSNNPVVSADGRYVAFISQASNLVANDSNGSRDVFVRDLVTGTTTLVSTTGTSSGNRDSFSPVISADGRYVAFISQASNLVANDSNGTLQDVFVRDLVTGTTTLVSTTGTASGNNQSFNPVVSADGRYVAFTSYASNLVANDSNSTQDVFLYDRTAASTTLVSRRAPSLPYLSGNDSSRAYSNQSLSADGRYVAFTSKASNLVANDSNSTISGTINDVFVRDRVNSTTTLVSTTGTAGGNSDSSNPVVSADGRYVAFTSRASNLVANDSNGTQDVFVRDLVNGMTTLVSTTGTASGNSDSSNPVVSADGRYVAFTSRASNLVANDSNGTQDVFVRNLVNGTTTLVSTTGTSSGNGYSANPVISADGRYVAFTSYASNLVANDTNSTQDVFVRDLVNGMTTLVSTTSTASGNSYSDNPVVSADGRYVAFDSLADNLVANDSNGSQDVFVRDLVNGTTTLVSTTGTASGNSYSYNPVVSAMGAMSRFSAMPATW